MKQAMRFTIDTGWLVVFKDLDLSPAEILKRAELPGDIFSRRTASLTIDEYFRLWYAIEKSIDDPTIPLIMGQALPVESFSPPIFAAFCSANFNVCVERLSRFKKLIGPMVLNVYKSDTETSVEFDCLGTDVPLPPFLVATELVFMVYLIRLATREHVIPVKIETQIPLEETAFQDYLGAKPVQGEKNRLTFTKEDAERPFLTENEPMWKFFEPELNQRLMDLEMDASFAARVRSALLEMLPSGNISIGDTATKLGVSKRTLQRRLSEEETTFQKELNGTREGLARHYLVNSDISNAEISFLIGFDDPSSFIRAFHIWTGQTPESFRRENSST